MDLGFETLGQNRLYTQKRIKQHSDQSKALNMSLPKYAFDFLENSERQ